uniref:1,4-dihydroxy-2-naphthoate octaprenyltransferase n=1 Tax=Streptomyces sp. WT6 TaxID=1486372 RepID=A0A023PXY6_9ACTN|nr:hypothetical protein wt6.38c [Streptomyces sp. WT6]
MPRVSPLRQEQPMPFLPILTPSSLTWWPALIRLGRVKFLFQSLLAVSAATAVIQLEERVFRPGWFTLALAFAWCGHLMTHYCNEYFDLDADRANKNPTSWTGGSRVLVDGLLPPLTSLSTGFVLLAAEVLMLSAMPTWQARVVAAAIIVLAWFYTAPPLRLNYRALGEVTCGVVVYGLVPLLTALLQTSRLPAALLVSVGVLAAQGALRMLVMNLSDIEGDREVGKLTAAGAMGTRGTIWAYGAGQVLCYGTVIATGSTGLVPPLMALALLALAPIPIWVTIQLLADRITHQRGATAITFWASMQMALGSTAILVGATAQSLTARQSLPTLWLVIAALSLVFFGIWLYRTVRRSGADARSMPVRP